MKKLITVDSEILNGTPVFTGTRVPIKNLFDYLESGQQLSSFLEDFPTIQEEQAIGVIALAEKLLTSSSRILNEDLIRRMSA